MDGYVTISTNLDTKNFEAQIKEVEYELQQIDYELSHAKELKLDTRTISEYNKKAEELNNKLISLREKQAKIDNIGKGNFLQYLEDMGKGAEKNAKKVAKWALAVFGLRSAYMFVRNAVNTIAGNDEQLKADIDYMKNALAYSIEPLVRGIVNLAKQLLIFIGTIIKAMTDKNIFENANKNLAGANKQAKALSKTLAGFDEMNVLQDPSSGDTGGGTVAPSFDLSTAINEEQTEKLKSFWTNIMDFWENDWEEFFTITGSKWDALVMGLGITFKGLYDIFKGVIEIIIGVWDVLVALFKGDFEGLNEAWKKLCDGFWNLFKGAFEIIYGILTSAVGIIKGIFGTIFDIAKNIISGIVNYFVDSWKKTKEDIKGAIQWIKNMFNSIGDFFSGLISKIQGFFKEMGTKAGESISGAFKAVVNGVLGAIENILNFPIKAINKLIDTINSVPGINLGTLSTFKLPRLAKGTILNAPGKGVPVAGGSALAGEAGREAYLPLSDSQLLEELGSTIGKYITIHATIPVYAYNRQVDRQIKIIKAEEDFAYNR